MSSGSFFACGVPAALPRPAPFPLRNVVFAIPKDFIPDRHLAYTLRRRRISGAGTIGMWRGERIGLAGFVLLIVVLVAEGLRVLPIRLIIALAIWLVISVPLGVGIGSCVMSSDD
jgi:hypothetical protein